MMNKRIYLNTLDFYLIIFYENGYFICLKNTDK